MRFIVTLLISLSLFSCGSTEPAKTKSDTVVPQAQSPVLIKGGFTELTVNANPSNAFTVYLTSGYSEQQKYPVIIFFDAHGNGKLPLEKYKSIAEKHGFILVGSNSSKNGMPGNETMRIGNELVEQVKNSLSIDTAQITVCGFSGGSRVASNIALSRNDIKGLICNSAAPPATTPRNVYVGLAGLGDMNYLEMRSFMQQQSANAFPHELLVFNGKHEWAPPAMMESAMLICTTFNRSTKQYDLNAAMTNRLEEIIVAQVDSVKKTSCSVADNLLAVGLRASGKSTDGKRKIQTVSLDKNCVKSDEAAWAAAEKEETTLQEELGSALLAQDTTWWKTNAARYFESDKQGADRFMHQRLRGYASLMCYSYANQAFQSNNLHAAEKFVAVYEIVDPENSEWAYMRANLYMQLGLNDYALSSLEKAVALGFSDKNRLISDPVFLPIRGEARFSALLGNMN